MHNELYENFTYVFQENNELSTKLQQAETENASLKSTIGQLENRLLTLSEKLEDANNEIGRLGMVLKHRVRDTQFDRRFDSQGDWSHSVPHHH